jgi:hypothetical protein
VKIEDGKSIEVPVWVMVYLVHRTGCAEAVAVETTSANARALIDFIALSSDRHGAKSRNANYVPDACCYRSKARELLVFVVRPWGTNLVSSVSSGAKPRKATVIASAVPE